MLLVVSVKFSPPSLQNRRHWLMHLYLRFLVQEWTINLVMRMIIKSLPASSVFNSIGCNYVVFCFKIPRLFFTLTKLWILLEKMWETCELIWVIGFWNCKNSLPWECFCVLVYLKTSHWNRWIDQSELLPVNFLALLLKNLDSGLSFQMPDKWLPDLFFLDSLHLRISTFKIAFTSINWILVILFALPRLLKMPLIWTMKFI